MPSEEWWKQYDALNTKNVSMTMTYVLDNAPTPYSGRLNIANIAQRERGLIWVLQPGSGYCFTSVTDNIVGDMLSYKPTQIAYKHMYIHLGDLDTRVLNVEAIHGWEVDIIISCWLIGDVAIGVGALYNLSLRAMHSFDNRFYIRGFAH